ncbi:hypothetical protein L195_g052656 [Trifolium pratense]|uniref:Uncharacterized protein n=1 Tax=Trifolium pratense TaxID=57577 RepID=A0A2K3K6B6_TRIPR|nr:hypothetical protein L195_g052656 [Trifolium pratense]
MMQEVTATLTSGSECLKSLSATNAFKDGEIAACIDGLGSCSTIDKKPSTRVNSLRSSFTEEGGSASLLPASISLFSSNFSSNAIDSAQLVTHNGKRELREEKKKHILTRRVLTSEHDPQWRKEASVGLGFT